MKPADLLREILFPLTDLTVLMAIVGLGSLLWLADAGGWFGIWLAFIVVPAIFRYAIYLLEARAHGGGTHVAGIEIFNIADNFWGIFPLILLAAVIWVELYIVQNVSLQAAQLVLGIFFLVYPASMAVLGITRSPIESVNPVVLIRMIRACGLDYLWIPAVLILVMLAAAVLTANVLPGFLVYFIGIYIFFLLFTLTGAVLNVKGIAGEIGIDAAVERSEAEISDDLREDRQKVANHAYGFISRGNREGGFAHIRQWIESEADANDAVTWFFHEMMRWEKKDAALFFAQDCLAHFLHHGEDAKALKLMSSCIFEDPRWKPRAEDRQHAVELAERYGRDDLVRSLHG